MKPILYIDMDDTIVDFDGAIPENEKQYDHPEYYKKGFFANLKPLPGALLHVTKLINDNNYDIWILTQPLVENPYSYTEKAQWIERYLPKLKHKIIMTQDKTLLKGEFLIDDNPKWKKFIGGFLQIDPKDSFNEWNRLYDLLTKATPIITSIMD